MNVKKNHYNNLVQIFELETVAFTNGDITPFFQFTRDFDGGINSLVLNELQMEQERKYIY